MEEGETVRVRAFYGPWNGIYMFHCHNLVHEDHLMMDVMNVTKVEEFGYDFEGTQTFIDPLDERYLARDVSDEAYEPAAISSMISALGTLNAYVSIKHNSR